MASRDRPDKGLFSVLNAFSTADLEFIQSCNRRRRGKQSNGRYWELERLVQRREKDGVVRMLWWNYACSSQHVVCGLSFWGKFWIGNVSSFFKVEYLVLWKGYSPYEATWVPEQNITAEALRLFRRPRPDDITVQENVARFRVALERHLKSKSRLPVTVFFRGDVFRFLFYNKGVQRENWVLLN